jgi:uncharacterized protein (TIRG00374 family)
VIFMSLKPVLIYSITISFLIWCGFSFRSDLGHIQWGVLADSWPIVVGVAALSLINYFCRAVRWRWYLSRLGHSFPLSFVLITYLAGFAFTLSPGKLGEMVRGRYYQDRGVPLAHSAAAFFTERLMDLLVMISLAACGVAYFSAYHGWIWIAVSMVLMSLMSLAFFPWQKVQHMIANHDRWSVGIKNNLQQMVYTIVSAQKLLHLPLLIAAFVLGCFAWGLEGVGLMQLSHINPDLHLNWSAALGIYAFAMIVGALSFLPGGLGGTEATMIALLLAFGYPMPDAILLTLVCRLLTLWFAVAIGWLAVALLHYCPALLKREKL